jgi:hypothetical protein
MPKTFRRFFKYEKLNQIGFHDRNIFSVRKDFAVKIFCLDDGLKVGAGHQIKRLIVAFMGSQKPAAKTDQKKTNFKIVHQLPWSLTPYVKKIN